MHRIAVNIATTAALAMLSASAAVHAAESSAVTVARSEVAQGKGTVVRVDATAGIVNLKHEAIPALKWPAMTMDFRVIQPGLLAGLRPGQTIVFALVKDPAAGYIISRIETAK